MSEGALKLVGAARFACRPHGVDLVEKGGVVYPRDERARKYLLSLTYVNGVNDTKPLFVENLAAEPTHRPAAVEKTLEQALADGDFGDKPKKAAVKRAAAKKAAPKKAPAKKAPAKKTSRSRRATSKE